MADAGKLDEFQRVRLLGRGGMGDVYLGHDTVLDRAVAIKLISARSPDARSRERFLVEARAIARVAHPNAMICRSSSWSTAARCCSTRRSAWTCTSTGGRTRRPVSCSAT
jgi:serine/threonine protein kinase